MYGYLNNFHKRMEKLSYSYLIDSKASTLTFYKTYFTDIELINLIYTLMVFILEKSLKDEECTIDNMAGFLGDIIAKYYSMDLPEEKVLSLTHDIVYKILRNDGLPFNFQTIDYESGKRHSYNYHLLQQKSSAHDDNKSTFYLEKEGYRLILNSLEVDERLQIDLNQMILELSLKKKNFSGGVDAVENLNKLITAQIQIIKNFTIKIRENILIISSDEFEKNYMQNINVLKEQNNRFYKLYDLITKEEEQLQLLEVFDVKKYQSLKQLDRIKECLISITEKASALIGYHFQFKEEYEDALEHYSSYYQHKRLSIKDHLLKPLEKDAKKLGIINSFFNGLFNAPIPKRFNLDNVFRDQDLYLITEEEKEVSIIDISSNLENLKLLDIVQYQGIIDIIFAFLLKKGNTSLKELMETFIDSSDYSVLVPSVRKLGEVLIELLRLGKIDSIDTHKRDDETYQVEEIVFDLRRMIASCFSKMSPQSTSFNISFMNDLSDRVIKIKGPYDGDVKHTTILKCPNIIMKYREGV